jgi:hypothetical protein
MDLPTGRECRCRVSIGVTDTLTSLEYDCLYGVANGLRTTIGDHFHPRGDLNRAVMQLDQDTYRRLDQLGP